MRTKMKTKLLPLLMLVLVMSMMLIAMPLTASAEEPPEDFETYDEYGYPEGWYDDDIVELPDEYYPSYEPAFEDGENPFDPDGTGTVINNATDNDGKEFYTIETPDGNIFYLVIDRQRSTDNVYFLGAVTEEDLMSLAQIERKPDSTAGATFPNNIEADETLSDEETQETDNTPSPAAATSSEDLMLYVIIGIAVIGVGGAGYYIKIVKPKKEGSVSYDDDYGEDYDDNDDDNSGSDNNDNYEDDEDEYIDEDEYEDEADMDFDDGSALSPDGDGNMQQRQDSGGTPAYQGNRSSRRRRRKRRRPNNSG